MMLQRGVSSLLIVLLVWTAIAAFGFWVLRDQQIRSSQNSIRQITAAVSSTTRSASREVVKTSDPEMQNASSYGVTGDTSSTVFSSDGNNATYTSYMYGLSVAFDSRDYSIGQSPVAFDADFVDQSQPIQVVFLGDNSETGFAVFVDPTIHAASSCAQFGILLNRGAATQETISGTSYSSIQYSDASMANTVDIITLHTFQNDLCYALDIEYLQSNEELYPPETSALEDSFLQGISFFQPEQSGS